MTRFARASGSKGANEKTPEEASSWQELRASVISNPETPTESKTKINTVEIPSVEEIQSVWADLVSDTKNSKKDKLRKSTNISEGTGAGVNLLVSKKSKDKKKKKKTIEADTLTEKETIDKKDKKKNKKRKVDALHEMPSDKKAFKEQSKAEGNEEISAPSEVPTKRRKEALKSMKVMINGQEVRVAPFDGFMVQADDALRLHKLRQDMRKKGIPKAEIDGALKMERRRAEKTLARLKKRVCFHCRGSGHNLSECPEVKDGRQATGICFKCGSTEHTHFQCKVNRKTDFPFAECFVCKEQGHIARQCPDNPRGLYPRGGGCSLCLDVTHLKKDCPKYLAQKSEELITVAHRNDRSLEALEEDQFSNETMPQGGKQLNKRIKF